MQASPWDPLGLLNCEISLGVWDFDSRTQRVFVVSPQQMIIVAQKMNLKI